jgi:hypothetical protein
VDIDELRDAREAMAEAQTAASRSKRNAGAKLKRASMFRIEARMKLAIAQFVCLDERLASLSAKRALCGALLHRGIVTKPLALRRAQLARLCTCITHPHVIWTAARHHLRRSGTEVGAIAAASDGVQMVRMSVTEHLQAISGAVIARALAIRASPRDLQQS